MVQKNCFGFNKQLLLIDHQKPFLDSAILPVDGTMDNALRIRKMLDACGACHVIKGGQPKTEYFSVVNVGGISTGISYAEALLRKPETNDLILFHNSVKSHDFNLEEAKSQISGTVAHKLFMPIID